MDWFLYGNGHRHEHTSEHTSELQIKKALWDGKIAVDVSLESVWDCVSVFGIVKEYLRSYKSVKDYLNQNTDSYKIHF